MMHIGEKVQTNSTVTIVTTEYYGVLKCKIKVTITRGKKAGGAMLRAMHSKIQAADVGCAFLSLSLSVSLSLTHSPRQQFVATYS